MKNASIGIIVGGLFVMGVMLLMGARPGISKYAIPGIGRYQIVNGEYAQAYTRCLKGGEIKKDTLIENGVFKIDTATGKTWEWAFSLQSKCGAEKPRVKRLWVSMDND